MLTSRRRRAWSHHGTLTTVMLIIRMLAGTTLRQIPRLDHTSEAPPVIEDPNLGEGLGHRLSRACSKGSRVSLLCL